MAHLAQGALRSVHRLLCRPRHQTLGTGDGRRGARGGARRKIDGTRFTCFTSTKVQILTPKRKQSDADEEEQALPLEYVVLDEAGALLEPDAVGCLLHGARALLLVGDHYQLPPFSKWQGAVRLLYCRFRALIDP